MHVKAITACRSNNQCMETEQPSSFYIDERKKKERITPSIMKVD
jgi:hypothetical protein